MCIAFAFQIYFYYCIALVEIVKRNATRRCIHRISKSNCFIYLFISWYLVSLWSSWSFPFPMFLSGRTVNMRDLPPSFRNKPDQNRTTFGFAIAQSCPKVAQRSASRISSISASDLVVVKGNDRRVNVIRGSASTLWRKRQKRQERYYISLFFLEAAMDSASNRSAI